MLNQKINSILFDTNILLDYLNDDREKHMQAIKIVQHCEKNKIALLIAQHSFNDVYYLQKRAFKSKYPSASNKQVEIFLCDFFNDVLDFFTVVGADCFDTKLALKLINQHIDFEDNLVIAAANRAKADIVLSNDQQMIKNYPDLVVGYKEKHKD